MLEKLNKYIVLFFFVSLLCAQFEEASVTFDDRQLKADEKVSLFQLQNNIKKFYEYSVWNDEYRDLKININVQILFEGNANIGSSQAYGIQSLFSNNKDLHFFDKGSNFVMSQNNSLYYDSVYFDPLSSLLGFYGNIILGAEIDTWSPLEGSNHYEKARAIAVRASASNFSRGWDQRMVLINLLTENIGLRKLRFSTYLAYELFENGEIDACGEALDNIVKNLNEVVDNYNQEIYTNTFMKYHGKKIGELMQKLGQKKLLQKMIYLDSQRDNIYKDLLSSI